MKARKGWQNELILPKLSTAKFIDDVWCLVAYYRYIDGM